MTSRPDVSGGSPDSWHPRWGTFTSVHLTICRDVSADIEALLPPVPWQLYKQYGIHAVWYIWWGFSAPCCMEPCIYSDDDQEPGVEQRQYRNAAYRQFVLWQHGRRGEGNRVVIPSCPNPRGQYTGFRVRRQFLRACNCKYLFICYSCAMSTVFDS